jgi:hypothetical protein
MGNRQTLVTLGTQDTGQKVRENPRANQEWCLVHRTLQVSLDCPFLICPLAFSNLCPVSCAPYVTSVSGLPILDLPLGFL